MDADADMPSPGPSNPPRSSIAQQIDLMDVNGTDPQELLDQLGLTEDVLRNEIQNDLMQDVHYAACMAEVRDVVGAWTADPDSPFEHVPETSDGIPDVVQILICMFDGLGDVAVNVSGSWKTINVHGALVLLALFHIHCRIRKLQTGKALSLSSIRSPVLAQMFIDASNGVATDLDVALQSDRIDNGPEIQAAWSIHVARNFAPFRHGNSLLAQDEAERVVFPFDPTTALTSITYTTDIGTLLFNRPALDFDLVGKGIFRNTDAAGESRLQLFSRWIDAEANRLAAEAGASGAVGADGLFDGNRAMSCFPLFCNALFKAIVNKIDVKNIHKTGDYDRGPLESLAVLGMHMGANAVMHTHHETMTSTLRLHHKPHLTELPLDATEHIFHKQVLHALFNNYPRTRIRRDPPANQSPIVTAILMDKTPCYGQPLTVDRLVPSVDWVIVPPYKEFAIAVTNTFKPNHRTYRVESAVRHAIALRPEGADAPDLSWLRDTYSSEYEKHKNMQLGVRQTLAYVRNSNKVIGALRAVCKTFAEMFKEFVFRPYIELGEANEPADTINGSEGLKGAPTRDVRFTNKPQYIHVFFARKTIKIDSETDSVSESWQYVNPSIIGMGCNAIRVRGESEPDENGRVVRFDVDKGLRRSEMPVERHQRKWSFANGNSFAHHTTPQQSFAKLHHVQAESLSGQSIYSLHLGADWQRRLAQPPSFQLVCLWDKKFPIGRRHEGAADGRPLDLALAQSMTFKATCTKTSAALRVDACDPLRAMRFCVEFGHVVRSSPAVDAAGPDDIVPFTAEEMATFQPMLSSASEYFYSSTIPLDPAQVSKRAEKRKGRTAREKLERSRAATAARLR